MIGDPTAIRAHAHALRRRADEIHDLARHLTDAAQSAAWQGRAAEAMRAAVRHSAGCLRRTAALHDEAAEALEHHARRVGIVQDALDSAVDAIGHVLGALG
jgi:uncharacterized protein YukE